MSSSTSTLSPAALKQALPLNDLVLASVQKGRDAIEQLLEPQVSLQRRGAQPETSRLVVMVGPCSIHDAEAAMEYATRLAAAAKKHEGELLVAMRVYVEKPRTTVGWKGLMHDPELTEKSSDLASGLYQSREIMLRVAELGLPVVTEVLSPLSMPFFEDVLACGVIGARTTESQTHRELASDAPMAIGFKNGTDGTLGVALDAMKSAAHQHTLLAVDDEGRLEQRVSRGNSQTFLVLRGGKSGPNYSAEHVRQAEAAMVKSGQPVRIVVDCSHGNSLKDYRKQSIVASSIAKQVAAGAPIAGLMLESNINPGRQDIPANGLAGLQYGVSVTDGCIGWEETESVLDILASAVKARRSPQEVKSVSSALERRRSSLHQSLEKLRPTFLISELSALSS